MKLMTEHLKNFQPDILKKNMKRMLWPYIGHDKELTPCSFTIRILLDLIIIGRRFECTKLISEYELYRRRRICIISVQEGFYNLQKIECLNDVPSINLLIFFNRVGSIRNRMSVDFLNLLY